MNVQAFEKDVGQEHTEAELNFRVAPAAKRARNLGWYGTVVKYGKKLQ